MCRTDNYILRITSTSLADGITLNDSKSELSFETPDYLRKKGKCKITVVGGNICLVDGNNRLNANSTKTILCLNSNIPQLGYFTETRGTNTVLGTCPTVYTGTDNNNDGYNVPFASITPLIFTCPELPPVIKVQRMVYNGTVFEELTSASSVPFYVELDIQFYEDMPKTNE